MDERNKQILKSLNEKKTDTEVSRELNTIKNQQDFLAHTLNENQPELFTIYENPY